MGKNFSINCKKIKIKKRLEFMFFFKYNQSTINGSCTDIVEILFERQEDIPKWSPAVNDCKVCIARRIISASFT